MPAARPHRDHALAPHELPAIISGDDDQDRVEYRLDGRHRNGGERIERHAERPDNCLIFAAQHKEGDTSQQKEKPEYGRRVLDERSEVALDEPEQVRRPRLRGEVVYLVVHQDARAGDDDHVVEHRRPRGQVRLDGVAQELEQPDGRAYWLRDRTGEVETAARRVAKNRAVIEEVRADLREVLGVAISRELKDPRVGFVTVTERAIESVQKDVEHVKESASGQHSV